MAEQLTPITSLANNTVNTLIALANAIVNTIATTAVTANASANGALTNGNGYVSGIFGASVLATGMLRGGNVASSANLIIGSNTFVNAVSLSVGNTTQNSVVNSTSVVTRVGSFVNATVQYFPQSNLSFANCNIAEIDLTTSGLTSVNLDSWPLATFRSAEYLIQVTDNVANNKQTSKLIITHDGTSALWDEYAVLTTNSTIAAFAGVTNATTLSIQVTPASSNTTIRSVRTAVNL